MTTKGKRKRGSKHAPSRKRRAAEVDRETQDTCVMDADVTDPDAVDANANNADAIELRNQTTSALYKLPQEILDKIFGYAWGNTCVHVFMSSEDQRDTYALGVDGFIPVEAQLYDSRLYTHVCELTAEDPAGWGPSAGDMSPTHAHYDHDKCVDPWLPPKYWTPTEPPREVSRFQSLEVRLRTVSRLFNDSWIPFWSSCRFIFSDVISLQTFMMRLCPTRRADVQNICVKVWLDVGPELARTTRSQSVVAIAPLLLFVKNTKWILHIDRLDRNDRDITVQSALSRLKAHFETYKSPYREKVCVNLEDYSSDEACDNDPGRTELKLAADELRASLLKPPAWDTENVFKEVMNIQRCSSWKH